MKNKILNKKVLVSSLFIGTVLTSIARKYMLNKRLDKIDKKIDEIYSLISVMEETNYIKNSYMEDETSDLRSMQEENKEEIISLIEHLTELSNILDKE